MEKNRVNYKDANKLLEPSQKVLTTIITAITKEDQINWLV